MNKITGDMTEMAAQIPALFETLQRNEDVGAAWESEDHRREIRSPRTDPKRSKVMALLERVATLVRANLNDLIDKAEEPEKMIKQVILDMQNQLLQVKTQVAIAIADQHLLMKKQKGKSRRPPRNGSAKRSWPWKRSRTTWLAPRLSGR